MIRRMQEQVKAGSLQGLSWEQIERLMSELGQTEQRMGGGGEIADELMRELEGQGGRSDGQDDVRAFPGAQSPARPRRGFPRQGQGTAGRPVPPGRSRRRQG